MATRPRLLAADMSHDPRRAEEVPVPGEGAPQAFFQGEMWVPAEQAAGFRRVQVLMPDLLVRLGPDVGRQVLPAPDAEEHPDQLEHGQLDLVAEVEGLAGELRVGVEALGQGEVSEDGVLDVEVITDVA